ncbi:MAG: Ig-like domain-containing protein [Paludibacteraceae bacterium]|nr:Ig-like domain-containing protein [Paludibacteraceae bacterium]
MKKITLLLTAFFMAVSLMADTYTHTFAKGELKNGTVELSNVEWNFSMTGSTYFDWDGSTNKGIQMGKSKEPATSIVLSSSAIAGKITKVVVNTSGASSTNAKMTVTVNGQQYGSQISLTSSAKDFSFEGDQSGEIKLTWTQTSEKAIYIKSVKVEYENIVAGVPTISASNIDFGTIFATDTTKTLTVVGSDLTENITATLKTGTAFELSGDLTKDGGDLTVKFIATEEGTYSDEITLTSGETTKTIEVSATLVATEGNGTKENPYTCDDVKLLNNSLTTGKYWVKGYILGCIKDNKLQTSSFEQASNIALGATADAEDYVPVQLSSGSTVREALNLVDNANMAGALVKVYGTLESYFSKTGVKSVSDYEIIESAPEVEATAIALDKTTLALEQYREDKLVATLTPAEANTQIVWTSSNAEVATIQNGLVKAVGVGEATITATAGELTATCVVTVSEATVLTCVKAAEMALEATADNAKIEGGQYVVSGYVTEIAYKYDAESGNMSVWIADEKDGGKVFELYKVEPQGGVIPVVGDSVVAIGYLTKYNTTPEMAAGCVCRVIKNDGPTTNVDVTTISNIYTLNRTIVAEGEFEIYTVTGQNVTGMNGSLENGVYVVRTANAAVKVVVK